MMAVCFWTSVNRVWRITTGSAARFSMAFWTATGPAAAAVKKPTAGRMAKRENFIVTDRMVKSFRKVCFELFGIYRCRLKKS